MHFLKFDRFRSQKNSTRINESRRIGKPAQPTLASLSYSHNYQGHIIETNWRNNISADKLITKLSTEISRKRKGTLKVRDPAVGGRRWRTGTAGLQCSPTRLQLEAFTSLQLVIQEDELRSVLSLRWANDLMHFRKEKGSFQHPRFTKKVINVQIRFTFKCKIMKRHKSSMSNTRCEKINLRREH